MESGENYRYFIPMFSSLNSFLRFRKRCREHPKLPKMIHFENQFVHLAMDDLEAVYDFEALVPCLF